MLKKGSGSLLQFPHSERLPYFPVYFISKILFDSNDRKIIHGVTVAVELACDRMLMSCPCKLLPSLLQV